MGIEFEDTLFTNQQDFIFGRSVGGRETLGDPSWGDPHQHRPLPYGRGSDPIIVFSRTLSARSNPIEFSHLSNTFL